MRKIEIFYIFFPKNRENNNFDKFGPSCKVKAFVVAAGHGDKGIGGMSTSKLLVDNLLGRKTFMSIEPFMFNRIEN